MYIQVAWLYQHAPPCTQAWWPAIIYSSPFNILWQPHTTQGSLVYGTAPHKYQFSRQWKHSSQALLYWNRLRKYIFAYFIISQYWDGTGRWNLSSWRTRTGSSCIFNTMVADELVTQGSMASVAMILTSKWYCWNKATSSGQIIKGFSVTVT